MNQTSSQSQAPKADRIDQLLMIAKKGFEANINLQNQMDALCAAFLNVARCDPPPSKQFLFALVRGFPAEPQPEESAAGGTGCRAKQPTNQETAYVSPVRCTEVGQFAAENPAGDQPNQSPDDDANHDAQLSSFGTAS